MLLLCFSLYFHVLYFPCYSNGFVTDIGALYDLEWKKNTRPARPWLYLLKFQNQMNKKLNNDELALKMTQVANQNDESLRNRCVGFPLEHLHLLKFQNQIGHAGEAI